MAQKAWNCFCYVGGRAFFSLMPIRVTLSNGKGVLQDQDQGREPVVYTIISW